MSRSQQRQPTVPPRLSVWAYPWDLTDEGVDSALDWLVAHGFDAIELCPNYHAISTFSPRNRRRSQFYSEQGAVYFPARAERYGRIKPALFNEPEVLAVYEQTSRGAESRGMQLNAWVIGMFQPWLARAYPDTAIENAFGHRSFAATCPAHPDIQAYLPDLLADLCDQYSISGLTLENVGYPDFTYGWVRPRILVHMDVWTQFLAGLCFNEHSMSAARAHGVDPDDVRLSVARELRERLESIPDPAAADQDLPAQVAERCETDEEFRGYLEAREQAATGLVQAIRHALRRSRVRVGISEASLGWANHGLRLADLMDTIGALMISDPTNNSSVAEAQVRTVRDAGADIEITVNQTAHHEVDPHGPGFTARARRLREIEPDRVMVYNFGLLAPATLAHAGSVLREHLG